MKPKTKNILLGVSLGLNILLGLLVGGALIKACADKPAQNASSGLSLSSPVKLHDGNEKKALEPKKTNLPVTSANVDLDVGDAPNLVDSAVFYEGAWFASATSTSKTIGYRPAYGRGFYLWGDMDGNQLPAGIYYVRFTLNEDYEEYGNAVVPQRLWLGDFELEQGIRDAVSSTHNDKTISNDYLLTYDLLGVPSTAFFFEYDPSDWECVAFLCYPATALEFYLVDALVVPPEDVITFPTDYNPLVMFGFPYDGYAWGTLNDGNGAETVNKTLNGVFRIDGVIYDDVRVSFHQMRGKSYQATDGTIQSFPSNGDASVYYPVSITARPFGGGQRVDLWALKQGYANGAPYIATNGYWLNAVRQSIAVLYYDPTASGLSSPFPTYNVLDLLKVRTTSSASVPVVGGDGNADVFGLLGQGFTAVAGIMNIQILPYLTLGTLVFVPLVVLVILAILKVLNK